MIINQLNYLYICTNLQCKDDILESLKSIVIMFDCKSFDCRLNDLTFKIVKTNKSSNQFYKEHNKIKVQILI